MFILDVKIFYDGTIVTSNSLSSSSSQLVPGVSVGSDIRDIMGYPLTNSDSLDFPMNMLADQQAAMQLHNLGCDNKLPTIWQPSSVTSNTSNAHGMSIQSFTGHKYPLIDTLTVDIDDIPGLLSFTPKYPKIVIDKVPSNNLCSLHCQISTSSMRYDNKKFTIEVLSYLIKCITHHLTH